MMVEKKYLLSQDTLSKMLSRRLEVDHQSEMSYELIRGGLLGINLHRLVLLVQELKNRSRFGINRFNPRVQTPSQVESTDDEDSNEEIQVNPEGQQQSSFMSSGFVSNMLNPTPDAGIDSIFNLNTESTSLVDVLITTVAEPPLLLKPLEDNFLEFKQTNQFANAISTIPGIVDAYLANKIHEAVKIAVELQLDRLRDEAQAENEDFINKLDDNIQKIIKDQVKTSHAIAANLSELELKKILIDKMESNKSIYKSNEQKNLYKALVDTYESDKLILDIYGDTVSFKRSRDDEDKDDEPSVDQTGGPREEELVKNQSQPVYQRKRPPRHLASQLKGPNLITSLLASLLMQRSQCTLWNPIMTP
ncbi:hypothetical protein Tco_0218541 [Tanacetum coccineum]